MYTREKKIYFPEGLEKEYCSAFLDAGENFYHGENFNFAHIIFPSGFTEKDISTIGDNIQKHNRIIC